MKYKFKVLGSNKYGFLNLLTDDQLISILSKLNITIFSPYANKQFYLNIGLRKCTIEEATTLLLDVLFSDNISNTLKADYKIKLLSNPDDLFVSTIHQKEIYFIYKLLADVYKTPQESYILTDFDFFYSGELKLNPQNLIRILADQCKDSAKLKQWVDTFFEEQLASSIILDLSSYSEFSHKALINSFWFKLEDLDNPVNTTNKT